MFTTKHRAGSRALFFSTRTTAPNHAAHPQTKRTRDFLAICQRFAFSRLQAPEKRERNEKRGNKSQSQKQRKLQALTVGDERE